MVKTILVSLIMEFKMKTNYLLYLILVVVVLFRASGANLINNLTSQLIIDNPNLEVNILKNKNASLTKELKALSDFKNNIDFSFDYIVTNVVKNNYGFNNLIINGDNYNIGDEVLTENGLIGIITKVNHKTSEVSLIHDTNMIVNIENEKGKISGLDSDGNLIVKEISNYNNVRLNDIVYSELGSYIGRVIKIRYEVIDHYLTVKAVPIDNLTFVAIMRNNP